MTTKEKAIAIKEKYDGIPNKEISTGVYLQNIGRKYVYILNTWSKTTINKQLIEDFYETI
jgi:hypothetical protein